MRAQRSTIYGFPLSYFGTCLRFPGKLRLTALLSSRGHKAFNGGLLDQTKHRRGLWEPVNDITLTPDCFNGEVVLQPRTGLTGSIFLR